MRRFVLECQQCSQSRFRTSPIDATQDGLPGIDAASVQLAEHTYLAHGAEEAVSFVSVDVPDSVEAGRS